MGFVITDASEYLKRLTGEKSVRAIALRIGVAPTTIGRQVESELRPELVVRICREYGKPVIPELVAIGFITEKEAEHNATSAALASATDEQLALEILARVRDDSATATLTEPIQVDDLEGNVGGSAEDEIPHIGAVDVEALRRSGVALAADERDGIEEEQEQSQELP